MSEFTICGTPMPTSLKQIIWSGALQIANTYPTSLRSRYQAAAQNLRIPYWDWASNSSMPDLVNQPMISVNTPSGILNINNPLLMYSFHPQPSASDFPSIDGTVRFSNLAGSDLWPWLICHRSRNIRRLSDSPTALGTVSPILPIGSFNPMRKLCTISPIN